MPENPSHRQYVLDAGSLVAIEVITSDPGDTSKLNEDLDLIRV